jgi:hypothetical protein
VRSFPGDIRIRRLRPGVAEASKIVRDRRSLRPLADRLIEITKKEGIAISEAVKMVRERRLETWI